MHELAVTQQILETVLNAARREGAVRVTRVRLVLGDLSTFVDASVRFYWDMVAEGTLCEGSDLEFERVPAKFSCRTCGAEYSCGAELSPCPKCGGADVRVIGGDEFHVASIDVEMPEDARKRESSEP